MLPGGNALLLGPITGQLCSRQCCLCGEHHRFGRRASLQALPGSGDGPLALADIHVRQAALPVGTDNGQIALRRLGEQVQPPGLALHGQCINPALGQGAAGVELAAALQDRAQAQGQLRAVQATGRARAQRIFNLRPQRPRWPLHGLVALGSEHRGSRIDQAQLGVGLGHACKRVVQGHQLFCCRRRCRRAQQ